MEHNESSILHTSSAQVSECLVCLFRSSESKPAGQRRPRIFCPVSAQPSNHVHKLCNRSVLFTMLTSPSFASPSLQDCLGSTQWPIPASLCTVHPNWCDLCPVQVVKTFVSSPRHQTPPLAMEPCWWLCRQTNIHQEVPQSWTPKSTSRAQLPHPQAPGLL